MERLYLLRVLEGMDPTYNSQVLGVMDSSKRERGERGKIVHS
jgi:hypothetical protein